MMDVDDGAVERRIIMRVIYEDVVELAEVAIRCGKTAEKGKCMWCPFYDRCQIDFENRHILCAEIEQPKPPKGE